MKREEFVSNNSWVTQLIQAAGTQQALVDLLRAADDSQSWYQSYIQRWAKGETIGLKHMPGLILVARQVGVPVDPKMLSGQLEEVINLLEEVKGDSVANIQG